jgi:hypothetical protein
MPPAPPLVRQNANYPAPIEHPHLLVAPIHPLLEFPRLGGPLPPQQNVVMEEQNAMNVEAPHGGRHVRRTRGNKRSQRNKRSRRSSRTRK